MARSLRQRAPEATASAAAAPNPSAAESPARESSRRGPGRHRTLEHPATAAQTAMPTRPESVAVGDYVLLQPPPGEDTCGLEWIARVVATRAAGNARDGAELRVRWFYRGHELDAEAFRHEHLPRFPQNEIFPASTIEPHWQPMESVLCRVRVVDRPCPGDGTRGPFFFRFAYDPCRKRLKPCTPIGHAALCLRTAHTLAQGARWVG
jgi:hypothetical protein